MPLTLSNLKPAEGLKKKKKRVGRGGKRGTYSGKGQKGQRSRSGGRKRLKVKSFRRILQRIPKKKGFKSIHPKMEIVNIGDLDKKFKNGDVIDLKILLKNGLVGKIKNGVKILGEGKLTKKLTVKANKFSRSAEKAIKKAGGSAKVIK